MRRCRSILALLAIVLATDSTTAYAQEAPSQGPDAVDATLALGSAKRIRDVLNAAGITSDLVPAGRLRGVEMPRVPQAAVRAFRLDGSSTDDTRRSFVVLSPDAPPAEIERILKANGIQASTTPDGLVSPLLRPHRSDIVCPECLPVRPDIPGGMTPRLLPQLPEAGFSVASCASAAVALRTRAQQERGCYLNWGVNVSACTTPLTAVAHFERYLDSCTATAGALPDEDLSQLAVLTLAGSPRPFCSALLVSPRMAVTAAHCLAAVTAAEVRLRPWSSPDLEITVDVLGKRAGQALRSPDVPVVLALHADAPGAHDEVCFDDPSGDELLRLYGYLAGKAASSTPQSWAAGVRTGAFTCSPVGTAGAPVRLAMSRASCYRHSCQAYGGFSGSPIFSQSAASQCRTVVVGMHVGASGPPGLCTNRDTNTALTGTLVKQALDAERVDIGRMR